MREPPPIIFVEPEDCEAAALAVARGLTMRWLAPALADRLNVPYDHIVMAMGTLPTNYCVLLDSAEGVAAIGAAASLVLGIQEERPFMPGLH